MGKKKQHKHPSQQLCPSETLTTRNWFCLKKNKNKNNNYNYSTTHVLLPSTTCTTWTATTHLQSKINSWRGPDGVVHLQILLVTYAAETGWCIVNFLGLCKWAVDLWGNLDIWSYLSQCKCRYGSKIAPCDLCVMQNWATVVWGPYVALEKNWLTYPVNLPTQMQQ